MNLRRNRGKRGECAQLARGRRERKAHMQVYLQGLLSDLERKNVEAIAYLHDQKQRELQHFIGESQWASELGKGQRRYSGVGNSPHRSPGRRGPKRRRGVPA